MLSKAPLILKGVMSADDVRLAIDHGLDGALLSNHGGRNLDTSPPALLVLWETHAQFPDIITQHHPRSAAVRQGRAKPFSIYVDGGIRIGTDILKAVCPGGVAAGVGRPAPFATDYGQEGVETLTDILKDEFEVSMRDNGITSIDDYSPAHINTGAIDTWVMKQRDHPYAVHWTGGTRSRIIKLSTEAPGKEAEMSDEVTELSFGQNLLVSPPVGP